MGKFWTEKEIEAFVAPETRDLPMPDGTVRRFTSERLMWLAFDDLIRILGYTPERLVKLALQESEYSGYPFERTFPSSIGYLDHRLLYRRTG